MSKVMQTTSLAALLSRIAGEYRAKASIFEIPEKAYRAAFELEASSPGLEVMGGRVSLPVGPAAGPHSQIAPNLVAAYLAGSRIFELKTVQENDRLEIAKPCIDALDEGHNTEWSTELSLDDAREEYLRGWIAISLLDALYSERPRSFAFNMSVGYTLDGIRSASMDAFIEGMRDPAAPGPRNGFWAGALRELESFVASDAFLAAFGEIGRTKAAGLLASFPESPVGSVTLSTMHGCPPAEIERIGSYLIGEKGFDTYVKLNPTLLGFDSARAILDATGWEEIDIKPENFEHDLQFADALDLLSSLRAKAAAAGRRFGIKLSNTLANANSGGFLPGSERYMSGRALYPLTIALAAKLAPALYERVPEWNARFSYCGGAWAGNAGELIAAGLGPITIATDILKPGGYLRLLPAARAAVAALPGSTGKPDSAALGRLAERALSRPEYRAGWKRGKAAIARALPLLDCFAAPCVEACPVGQKVPEYIRLMASGASEAALAAILFDNPLPFITGTLCDHVCQDACCRNDYEGPVEIRAIKLAIAQSSSRESAGAARITASPARPSTAYAGRVAVIGAGPAGLACAHHLALAGARTSLFDESGDAGGVPANVIPRFRIPRGDIERDIERIRSLGVELRLRSRIDSLDTLRAEGFTAFFICAGAPAPRPLGLEGDAVPVVDALSFLAAASARLEGRPWALGDPARILVAGGGNTAMDAARLALRLPGVEEVSISYRRSRREMPADDEELRNALDEGAKLMELSLPESSSHSPEGPIVRLRIMELGERDSSGRRGPRPTARTESLRCDLLVAAVGETPDRALLEELGIECGEDGRPLFDPATQETRRPGVYVGGDAARGPASIIAAEADGRRAAYAILRSAGIEPPSSAYVPPRPDPERLASRGELSSSLGRDNESFVAREAARCLNCDAACLRCVEVCPNRANFALPAGAEGGFAQAIQILHLDYLCNECGNCGVFCPFEGEPFRGKPTMFRDESALVASSNAGFAFVACGDESSAKGFALRSQTHRDDYGAKGRELLVREEPRGPIARLGSDEWSEEGAGGRMAALARSVVRSHGYLIGGTR